MNINTVHASIFDSIFSAQEQSRKSLSELAEDAVTEVLFDKSLKPALETVK
jgi:hypothetical protein